jgi:LytS/YehU family sensor histidine kinase
VKISLLDPATAETLSQVLPLLLISIMVEVRRTRLHLRGRHQLRNRVFVAVFYAVFGLAETFFVLSIDGQLYPFIWTDIVAAALIFGLLTSLFVLSLSESRTGADPN